MSVPFRLRACFTSICNPDVRVCDLFRVFHFVPRDFGSAVFFFVINFIPVFTCSTVQESSVLIQLFLVQAVKTVIYTFTHIYLSTYRQYKQVKPELSANASVYIFTTSPNCTFIVLTYSKELKDSVPKPVMTLYTAKRMIHT